MRSLRLLTFVFPLLSILSCNDATAPKSAGPHLRAPQRTLVIPSTTPQVSAGGYYTCALKTDGTVICWGDNTYGQTTVPVGLASVAQVSAGGGHTCALKTDGTVVCWGQNDAGQTTVPDGLNP
jgi:alpha-tubulin suppressor-like RCC1 family protein